MELTQTEFSRILTDGMELAVKKAMVEIGQMKPFISKNQAYKRYGQGLVNRWISEGLITPQKDGTSTSSIRLNRMELETLSKTSNRHSYLTVAERKNK